MFLHEMSESKQVKIKSVAAIFRVNLTQACSDDGNNETIFNLI